MLLCATHASRQKLIYIIRIADMIKHTLLKSILLRAQALPEGGVV